MQQHTARTSLTSVQPELEKYNTALIIFVYASEGILTALYVLRVEYATSSTPKLGYTVHEYIQPLQA